MSYLQQLDNNYFFILSYYCLIMYAKRATPPAGQRRRSSEKITGDRRPSFEVDPELVGGIWSAEGEISSSTIPTAQTPQNVPAMNEVKPDLTVIPKNETSGAIVEQIELRTLSREEPTVDVATKLKREQFLNDMEDFSAQFETQNLNANAIAVSSEGIAGVTKFQEKVAMSQQKLAQALQEQQSKESNETNTKQDLLDFYFDDSVLKDLDYDPASAARKKSDEDEGGSIRRFLPPTAVTAPPAALATTVLTEPLTTSDTTLDVLGNPQSSAPAAVESVVVEEDSKTAKADPSSEPILEPPADTIAVEKSFAPLPNDPLQFFVTQSTDKPATENETVTESTSTSAPPADAPATAPVSTPVNTTTATTTTTPTPAVVKGTVVGVINSRSNSPLRPEMRTQTQAPAQSPGSPGGLFGKLASVPKLFMRKTYDDSASESEDGPEEGTPRSDASNHLSAILTKAERDRMTREQKAAWKCKQDDLLTKRSDFHGAVTYAFDGIFSWSMYGATEAVDTSGKPYTEYLMRCQWGTDWDNMEPWIVARRYSEFEQLHNDLRERYFSLHSALPLFPAKTLFGTLSEDTVKHRRDALEKYMTKIVNDLPTILRSRQIDTFLNIYERVSKIRENIFKSECGPAFEEPAGDASPFEKVSSLVIPPRSMSTDINDTTRRPSNVAVVITPEVLTLTIILQKYCNYIIYAL